MTKNSETLNRTLFLEDNLPVLRGLDSDSIDLIATDPPFNKGVGAFRGTTKAGQNVEFSDVWHWSQVQDEWLEQLKGDHPNLFNMILYANSAVGKDEKGSSMGAFICWMAVRVLEMHRVLKDTGSMYLHCDPKSSHYLKAMMDAIFGPKNFQNEVVWKRSGGKSDANRYGRVSDRVLFYTVSSDFVWNKQYQPHDPEYVRKTYRYDDNDGRGAYTTMPLHAASKSAGESGKPWKGIDPSAKDRHWATPIKGVVNDYIVRNGLIDGWPDAYPAIHQRLDALDAAGLVVYRSGLPRVKTYLSSTKGVAATDVVTDIPMVSGKEDTGWPTQKPLALYKRMIEASSNPGDMVLDPFAGCATTCVAAEQLERKWIGCDLDNEAGQVIVERLQREVNESMAWDKFVNVQHAPPVRTDDGEPAAPELILESPKKNEPKMSKKEAKAKLIEIYGMRCQGCGWVPPYADHLEVDHRKARSKKGKETLRNFGLLCGPCNLRKGAKYTTPELQEIRIKEGRMDMDWWEDEGKH